MLVRHLIRRCGESVRAAELRDCLEAAFCLPLARYVRAGVDYFEDVEYCNAVNKRLLPEILQHRREWDYGEADGSVTSWYEGLASTPPEEARAAADEAAHPQLSARTWANLSAEERDSLRLEMASITAMRERLDAFAALAERLQSQVERLEERQRLGTAAESAPGKSPHRA